MRQFMIHVILGVLTISTLLFLSMSIYVAMRQSSYIYYPDNVVSSNPADSGMKYDDLRIKTEDGETIHAWYVPVTDNDEGLKLTVILCHGNAGDIGDRVGTIQTLHKLGFTVLAFDYRGYGESTGRPTEKGTYLDAGAIWNYLVKTRNISPERIVIFGRSLGGAIAAQLALQKKPKALILESTFSSVPDMANKMFPFLPVRLFCRFRYDTVGIIKNVNCPVLVAHSKQDEMIPFEQSQCIYEAAKEPKLFIELQSDHNAGGIDIDLPYQKALLRFLDVE